MLSSARVISFAIPYIRNTTVFYVTQMKSELSQIELTCFSDKVLLSKYSVVFAILKLLGYSYKIILFTEL